MFQEIENIVFDLGGVLADLDIERCTAAFRALGMPQVAEWVNPYYPAEVFARLERGDCTPHEACERMRRIAGCPEVTDGQIAAAYRSFVVGLPVAKLRLLRALRDAGKGVFMLSNNNEFVFPYIKETLFRADGLALEDYFDKCYLSYEMHELKPSPAIFERMIADSGVRPETTLFVDDGEKNIRTARDLGFQVYMPGPREDFRHLFDDMLCGAAGDPAPEERAVVCGCRR